MAKLKTFEQAEFIKARLRNGFISFRGYQAGLTLLYIGLDIVVADGDAGNPKPLCGEMTMMHEVKKRGYSWNGSRWSKKDKRGMR